VFSRSSAFVLLLLVLAPWAGFLRGSLGSPTREPLDRRPSWAHLVVVTCDRVPEDIDLQRPGFATLERRAARVALRASEPNEPAVTAASLWSGRRMSSDELARTPGALPWSLACASQRSGAAGAAFLERPLATEARLSGFERVIEGQDLGPERLVRLAEEHFDREPSRRKLLWLHLADPGPRGERLDALLDGLHAAIDARDLGWDTLLLATALDAEVGVEIPLWAELPSDMLAGRQGRGTADAAEVACVVLDLLRLPAPDVTRGEVPVENGPDLSILLRGGTVRAAKIP
jgi:hypothetical protein